MRRLNVQIPIAVVCRWTAKNTAAIAVLSRKTGHNSRASARTPDAKASTEAAASLRMVHKLRRPMEKYGEIMTRVGIASDHGGYELKTQMAELLSHSGYDVVDFGAHQLNPADDYPEFIIPLARAVAAGKVERGIALCGSGVGASIAANKVAGVRAGLIHDVFSAHQGVEDDDMNVFCLGGKVIGPGLAWELVRDIPSRSLQRRSTPPTPSRRSAGPGGAGIRSASHSRGEMMRATEQLHNIGQSLWLDNITRGLLTSGKLARYIQALSVTGLTSNPTIFDHAVKNSNDYDAAICQKIKEGKSGEGSSLN